MPSRPGIFSLPSGSFNVKTTYAGERFNLGTYREEAQAIKALEDFQSHAPAMAERDGMAAVKEVAEEVRAVARKLRQKQPSDRQAKESFDTRIRKLEKKTMLQQNQIDKLSMQVEILQNLRGNAQ